MMEYNHEDLCHCFDYTDDCPKNCFRAKITKEFKENEDKFIGIPMTWSNFGGTSMCKKQAGCPCATCESEHCFNPLVCDKYMDWILKEE